MKKKRPKIGVIGCGAIGSRIIRAIQLDLKKLCRIGAIYDVDHEKADNLCRELKIIKHLKTTVEDLLRDCDIVVEAVSAESTLEIIEQALQAKKSVLAMSVGKLLHADKLFRMAKKNRVKILLPSGAIAGVDAIKAASLVGIKDITLTTRKPVKGLKNNPILEQNGIDLDSIKKEKTIFQGNVSEAVKMFPKNINVAATIFLAAEGITEDQFKIKIIASPHFKHNSHEIKMRGDFGTMMTRTENFPCPDNPRTSYLAALSGIQSLKQYCSGLIVGT